MTSNLGVADFVGDRIKVGKKLLSASNGRVHGTAIVHACLPPDIPAVINVTSLIDEQAGSMATASCCRQWLIWRDQCPPIGGDEAGTAS